MHPFVGVPRLRRRGGRSGQLFDLDQRVVCTLEPLFRPAKVFVEELPDFQEFFLEQFRFLPQSKEVFGGRLLHGERGTTERKFLGQFVEATLSRLHEPLVRFRGLLGFELFRGQTLEMALHVWGVSTLPLYKMGTDRRRMWWLFLGVVVAAERPRVLGWYDGHPPLTSPLFPWDTYTHLRYGAPLLFSDGHVKCNQTLMLPVTTLAHQHNVSVLWAPALPGSFITEGTTPERYWDTIGSAVDACHVDGIEVDYEHVGALGIVTPDMSNRYSEWLAKLRRTIRKPVGADLSLPGIAPGNYPLGWAPWVNITMLNRGDFDYINTMSYHWSREGSTWAWKKDIWVLLKGWGVEPSRINLGVPLFSKRGPGGAEPTWGALSPRCPNAPLTQTTCDGVLVVSKQMMLDLGHLVWKHGLGGLFPWMIDYDSYTDHNTLARYLLKGYK